MATQSSIRALEKPMTEKPGKPGSQELDMA